MFAALLDAASISFIRWETFPNFIAKFLFSAKSNLVALGTLGDESKGANE